ncbi:Yop proteins translocation protein L [Labrenzia sp. THAF82]|uniref:type III secretion system stator protein SctL n=1 Tax=Labrenzia sp. THAF82 TaxID=2587861 RepID=UPI00126885A8|nr:type III secretion system stator protein SctL [Labrenzia sp. THAF82]QFT33942.1 Yop proteins translocation protein L [Labrenzia sp. THAF82]
MNFLYNPQKIGLAVAQGEGVIKAKDLEALGSASEIVSSAEARAAEIIAAAETEFQNQKERGYAEGRKHAQKEALTCLLEEDAYLDLKLQNLENRLASLVKSSVRKVLSEFDDSCLAVSATKSALRQMRDELTIQIRLAPEMVEAIEPVARAFEERYAGDKSIDLVEDEAIPAPNVVVETATGRIECNILAELLVVDDAIDNSVHGLYGDRKMNGVQALQEAQS